jgi:hypothetical protein
MHGEETLMQFKKGGKGKRMVTKKKCQEPFSDSRMPERGVGVASAKKTLVVLSSGSIT